MSLTLEKAVEQRVFCSKSGTWLQPCIHCENHFPVQRSRKYCSETCNKLEAKSRTQKQDLKKTCANCGNLFCGGRSDKIYCSNRCGNSVRSAKWESKNPEKVKEKRDTVRAKSWNNYLLSRIKHKSKMRNIAFDLSPIDLVPQEVCPVLGIKLNYNNKGSGYHHDSPSIDRIIPSLGYVKGNVRVISARANLLKSDATVEELELVLEDLRKITNQSNEVSH